MKRKIILLILFCTALLMPQQDVVISIKKDNLDNSLTKYWFNAKDRIAENLKNTIMPEAVNEVLFGVHPLSVSTAHNVTATMNPPVVTITGNGTPNELKVTISIGTAFNGTFNAFVPILYWQDVNYSAGMTTSFVLYVDGTTKQLKVKQNTNAVTGSYHVSGLGIDENFSIEVPGITIDAPLVDLKNRYVNLSSLTYDPATQFISVKFASSVPSVAVSVNNTSYGSTLPPAGTYYTGGDFRAHAYPTSSGYRFVNWKVNGNVAGSENPKTITVTGNSSLQAVFNRNMELEKGGAEEIAVIPTVFSVSQNYPNPFNPTSTIQYGLPEPGIVDITIKDIVGREILHENISTVSAGYHTYLVNAANSAHSLSSGVYIYTVRITGISGSRHMVTKKMQLVK